MSDIKILNDQITGLKAKLVGLRKDKSLFDKAKGLDEQVAKFQKEAEGNREEAKKLKDVFERLMAKKNATVAESLKLIMDRMNAVLPAGKAVLESHDGDVFIGWHNGKANVSYAGLSGGERVSFDTALTLALGASVLIAEFAELDAKNLTKTLELFDGSVQVLGMSCHRPETLPKDWNIVEL